MEPIAAIIELVTSVVSRIWPDKTEQGKLQEELIKQQLAAQLQIELSQNDLLKGQLNINQAEAANPNRRWISWRELTGYICAFGLGYNYIILPFLLFGFAACHHPVDVPKLDIGQLLSLLTGMLGLGVQKTYEKYQGLRPVWKDKK